MGGLVEVERALSGGLAMGLLFDAKGGQEAGAGERLLLGGSSFRRSVGFSAFAPHVYGNIIKFRWFALPSLFIIIQMETPELQKYELVESFLNSIKQAQSKQEFLSRVNEFDSRFIEDHSAPPLPERNKSVEKLPPMPQEKPKNPFKTNIDDNIRHQNMTQTGQYLGQPSPFSQQAPVRGNYSRTQQNFYRGQQPPQGPNLRNDAGTHSQSHIQQQFAGGMGVLNYNAFSQRQYDQLKEQFFRPPMQRPLEPYNRMSEDAYNFGPMGMALGASSSSDLLPGETSFSRPTPRAYPDRSNAFMKQ